MYVHSYADTSILMNFSKRTRIVWLWPCGSDESDGSEYSTRYHDNHGKDDKELGHDTTYPAPVFSSSSVRSIPSESQPQHALRSVVPPTIVTWIPLQSYAGGKIWLEQTQQQQQQQHTPIVTVVENDNHDVLFSSSPSLTRAIDTCHPHSQHMWSKKKGLRPQVTGGDHVW